MWLVIIIILDGFLHGNIFEARVLEENLYLHVNKTQFSKSVIFQPKTKISPQNPCFKYFHEKIYIYIRGLHSVQSGVLPVNYSDHAAIYFILQ
jgi:hypothetical protein